MVGGWGLPLRGLSSPSHPPTRCSECSPAWHHSAQPGGQHWAARGLRSGSRLPGVSRHFASCIAVAALERGKAAHSASWPAAFRSQRLGLSVAALLAAARPATPRRCRLATLLTLCAAAPLPPALPGGTAQHSGRHLHWIHCRPVRPCHQVRSRRRQALRRIPGGAHMCVGVYEARKREQLSWAQGTNMFSTHGWRTALSCCHRSADHPCTLTPP